MDSFMWPFSDSNNGCEFDFDHGSDLDPNVVVKGIQLKDTSSDTVNLPLTSFVADPVIHCTDLPKRLDGESADENDFSNDILRYINQVLMEDDLEDKTCAVPDSTLHAAEKSFFEILNSTCRSPSNQFIPLEDSSIPPVAKENNFMAQVSLEEDEGDMPYSLVRGRKSRHREEIELEEARSNKHLSSVYGEDEQSVLHELFDKIVSLCGKNDGDADLPNATIGESKQNDPVKKCNDELTYTRKGASKREAISLRNLLMQCMQSVVSWDHRRTNKLLMQIRLRSSHLGDGPQRLAHYFANSLEARLAGVGNLGHKNFACRNTLGVAVLKAHKLFISAFPFVETSYSFANQMIMELADKATCIHIVHFGIVYGIEWPPLIQHLWRRPSGPPKLRMTGIDLPLAGFRPDARLKATGHHLANYCEKFGVPFEYNGIAQKWETVSVEDLKIEKGEVLVMCMSMSMYQPDDTIMEPSPRDAVLNLIKSTSPDIFIHAIYNGTYNSPFFTLRFREALFCFSTLFDMLEANVPHENQDRLVVERNIWAEEILDVVACEGLERIARPETYKQWQFRTLRAGFKQVPLNQEMMKKLKAKVKASYHKDFFVDESNHWMLQGWKGRVIFATSGWKPV